MLEIRSWFQLAVAFVDSMPNSFRGDPHQHDLFHSSNKLFLLENSTKNPVERSILN